MSLLTLLAAAPAPEQPNIWTSMLPLVIMFVLLYFLMLRPQQKRQKEHKKLIAGLTKGDEVIAAAGIMGRISKVSDDYVAIEVSRDGEKPVEMLVQRASISTVLPKGTLKSL